MSWQEQRKRDEEVEVKDSFREHYEELLGEKEYNMFMTCNLHYLRRAIRVNTLKASVADVEKRLLDAGWNLTPVPWCKGAFWIKGDRLDIGNLLEHQLGYIYIQDPASMLPPIILDPKPGMRVLDMCASPGSKTSQCAAMMNNEGIIIANDVQGSRLAPLGVNLQRLGVFNALLTKKDGRQFGKFEFDGVMVDAPCSGTGTLRRSLKGISMFNMKQIQALSRLQLQLLETAFAALSPGGVLTYSTCTLEPLENEIVVSEFLEKEKSAQILDIELDIKREKPFMVDPYTKKELHREVHKCLRIHPYTNDTEGFFVAKIRKEK